MNTKKLEVTILAGEMRWNVAELLSLPTARVGVRCSWPASAEDVEDRARPAAGSTQSYWELGRVGHTSGSRSCMHLRRTAVNEHEKVYSMQSVTVFIKSERYFIPQALYFIHIRW